jgi:hypothetical protein
MHKQANLSLLAGIFFAGAIGGAQPLTVIVHNYADVGVPMLERAQREAARILGTAGAEVKWVNCRNNVETSPLCGKRPDSTELVLDLLPAGTSRRGTSEGALGYAIPPKSSTFGSYAGVLFDRVERLSVRSVSKSVVLGHAMAHELGHLLLEPGWHAPSGIMMSEWHRKELHKAAQGNLVFRTADRRTIEENIRRRVEQKSRISPPTRPGGNPLVRREGGS